MEDKNIIDLFWERAEAAIPETANKYGKYCYSIAYNILRNHEDSEECVNDTYLNAWKAMPPHRPSRLSTFLGKITRNLSLNRWDQNNSEKRGGGQVLLALDELSEYIPAAESMEHIVDDLTLVGIFNRFLASLSKSNRKIFIQRYWYMSSIKEIATGYAITEGMVKMSLLRSRKALKNFLKKEGIGL